MEPRLWTGGSESKLKSKETFLGLEDGVAADHPPVSRTIIVAEVDASVAIAAIRHQTQNDTTVAGQDVANIESLHKRGVHQAAHAAIAHARLDSSLTSDIILL